MDLHHPNMGPVETERLKTLHSYQILDTEAEDAFDGLVRVAADLCEMPMAVMTLVDSPNPCR